MKGAVCNNFYSPTDEFEVCMTYALMSCLYNYAAIEAPTIPKEGAKGVSLCNVHC